MNFAYRYPALSIPTGSSASKSAAKMSVRRPFLGPSATSTNLSSFSIQSSRLSRRENLLVYHHPLRPYQPQFHLPPPNLRFASPAQPPAMPLSSGKIWLRAQKGKLRSSCPVLKSLMLKGLADLCLRDQPQHPRLPSLVPPSLLPPNHPNLLQVQVAAHPALKSQPQHPRRHPRKDLMRIS